MDFGFARAMSRRNQMQSSTNLQAFMPFSELSFTIAFGIIGGKASSAANLSFVIASLADSVRVAHPAAAAIALPAPILRNSLLFILPP